MSNEPGTTEARALADYIFRLDAQYQGGILKAASRDDFINRCIVPVLEAHMGQKDDQNG